MFIILFKLFFIFALQINENNWKTKQELNNYNNNKWSEFLSNFNNETKEKIEPEFDDFIYTNVMLGQMGNQNFNNIYIISELNLSRGEELCLAHIVCDSFLHSAPLSTFGFWMAYLLKENTPVFTIHKQIKMHPFYFDTINNLPPEWFQIEEKDLLLF
ncbi:hypothetical protein Mgra_00006217 [Meloidogyne graminicola]|uniref:Uncharacterized protein n=1 Tax=Meloidogyne graminicola TaxID=189291 RepID=A0A8S9ZMD2_9BILA|nr:hypothetical protein Mgra_00006217 [Meloidogyne graminicola]